MVIHLLTNASMMDGPATFQKAVYQIHGLGKMLPLIEWTFIFLPIIFHAVLGVIIIRGGLPNTGTYKYASNVRYTLQRATGLIAFVFIFLHVFHMHGWFHFDFWLTNVAEPLGGAQFKPYNASSTAAAAFQGSFAWTVFYAVGVLSCVFHLSNGIWSAGVRWGIWTSPAAMQRATLACTGFGLILAVVSTTALWAPHTVKIDAAKQVEREMYKSKLSSHEIEPNSHKRSEPDDGVPVTGDIKATADAKPGG